MKLLHDHINEFSLASDLHASPEKNVVFFGGVKDLVKDLILQETNTIEGRFPFMYYGVPQSTKKLNFIDYKG